MTTDVRSDWANGVLAQVSARQNLLWITQTPAADLPHSALDRPQRT